MTDYLQTPDMKQQLKCCFIMNLSQDHRQLCNATCIVAKIEGDNPRENLIKCFFLGTVTVSIIFDKLRSELRKWGNQETFASAPGGKAAISQVTSLFRQCTWNML